MRKVLVVNPKGGCGKTTLATNLASYYAVWGLPVALVDCDPQHSSLDWLAQRPADYDPIVGVPAAHGHHDLPPGMQRAVYDAPARSSTGLLERLLSETQVVLIPVLPSPIDIRAAARFVGELLLNRKARRRKIGLVANRVREQTLVYGRLEAFLAGFDIPFVTHLRDTQNYIRAADQGVGIFEMAPSQVDPDIEQWRPLINWIEGD